MSSDAYCEEKGAPPGSTAYYRRLFLPAPERAAVTALYALRREIDSVAEEVSEPQAAHMKLAWWREEVERLFSHAPRHPVTRALGGALERRPVQRELFDMLVAGAAHDLAGATGADDEARAARLQTGAAAQQIESELCGYRDPATPAAAARLGIALERGRLLREVRSGAARGHLYLPASGLERHRVDAVELTRAATPAHVRALFAEEARQVRDALEEAGHALPAIDRHAQCSGLVAAALERRLLAEIEDEGYRLLEYRTELTPLRKLWIAWRTARAARRASRSAEGSPR